MLKQISLFVLGLLLALPIVGALVGIKIQQFQAMAEAGAAFQMPPEVVNSATVEARDWQPTLQQVGSVVAVQGTVVSTEVEGVVRAIRFESGTAVKAGEVLVELDAELERVQLREAEVAAAAARTSFQRAIELNRSRNISREDYDLAETNAKRTEAQVDYYRTLIDKKTVRAPFSGQLGIRTISIGQYLPQGSAIVALQSLDPVHVEFSVPQHQFGLLDEGLTVEVSADAWPAERFQGKVTAITPDVNPATRSVRVQATLPNKAGRLRPGMSVAVALQLAQRESVLLIPSTAVVHGPYGDAVFVIEPESQTSGDVAATPSEGAAPAPTGEASDATPPLVLRQQPIRLGQKRGDFVVVTEGLTAGQQVVSTGVFKYRPGIKVVIDNRLAPSFSLNPQPGNS